ALPISSSGMDGVSGDAVYQSTATGAGGWLRPLSQDYLIEPPAATIFCSAEPETLSTDTVSFTSMSPLPRTLTFSFLRTAPLATRSPTVTSPPVGYSSASLARFTTWYSTRNGFLNPRSFGVRMCRGICPPSKPTRTVLRALVPLVPRPAVLPFEASPRPTRVFAVLAPGTGRRWWTLRTPGRDASASAFGAAFFAAGFLAASALGAAALAGAFLAAGFFSAAALGAVAFFGAFSSAAAFSFSAISRSPQP